MSNDDRHNDQKDLPMSNRTMAIVFIAAILAAPLYGLCAEYGAGPVNKDGRPRIKKLGAIEINTLETSLFVLKGRLYRMEWRHPDYYGIRASDCKSDVDYFNLARTCIVDHDTGQVVASPDTKGFILSTVFVDGDTVRVFATQTSPRNRVDMWSSNDLRTWRQTRLWELPAWTVFNVSVCKAEAKYCMSIEVDGPAAEAGIPFTTRFAVSKDLRTWETLPREYSYDWARFTSPHFLRYLDDCYYLFYVDSSPKGYTTNVVRSKDLKKWVSSPFNPILQPSDEDKRIANPKLSQEKQRYVKEGGRKKESNINNSDLEFVEYNGTVILGYGCGAQTGDYKFIAEAVYEGTESQFLRGWFPQ
jgi:hypothetical protein